MKQRNQARKDRVVVEQTTEIVTEPKVEFRRPATLAQALTERAVRVVNPQTRVTRVERRVRKAACAKLRKAA